MWQKFVSYIVFWKKHEGNNTSNFNLRMMHGINRISILMFLVGLIVLIFKLFIL